MFHNQRSEQVVPDHTLFREDFNNILEFLFQFTKAEAIFLFKGEANVVRVVFEDLGVELIEEFEAVGVEFAGGVSSEITHGFDSSASIKESLSQFQCRGDGGDSFEFTEEAQGVIESFEVAPSWGEVGMALEIGLPGPPGKGELSPSQEEATYEVGNPGIVWEGACGLA